MGIFIDTNIFIALRNEDDLNHKRAKEIMKKSYLEILELHIHLIMFLMRR